MNRKTLENVKTEIEDLRAEGRSWDDVAEFYGVSKAMSWRVYYENHEPKDNEIRRKLGLPEQRLADSCPVCDTVHVKPCPKRKPNLNRSLWQMTERERLLALIYRS